MSYLWQHSHNRLIVMWIVVLIVGGCTFPPPDPWSLPMRTIQVPARGEVGQVILPYLLERPDSLRIECPPQIQVTADLERDTLIIKSLDERPGNYLISLSTGKKIATIAVRVTPRFPVNFQYHTESGSMPKVTVVGSFTDWGRDPLPLHDLDRDGVYEATTYLLPQRYEYSLVVDGTWLRDPSNPDSVPNPTGGSFSILDLRDSTAQARGFFVRNGHSGRRFTFRYTKPSEAEPVDPQSIVILVDNLKLPRQQWAFDERSAGLQITFHLKTRGFVRILAQDQKGRICRETQFLLENGKTISASTPQESWYTQTIYFPITDRFYDGDPYDNWSLHDPDVSPLANYFGGDLEGIRYKIEDGYFDSLGIGTLWISPLNQGPDSAYIGHLPPYYKQTGYHGYWPIQPSRVEQRIGGHTAAQELVKTAHDHGLKVILDFVAHQTHRLHPYFSDHRDWYGVRRLPDRHDNLQRRDGETQSTWAEAFLPAFDYLHSSEALETMTENAVWWIRTFDIDGLRHDAINQVPDRFWITLSRKLREYFPGNTLYQLGQTRNSSFLSSSNVNSTQLDGQLNLDLYYNTRESFALGTGTMTDVAWTIERNMNAYEPLNLMGTFVSSHDHPRFISFADRRVSFTENPSEAVWSHPPTPARLEAHERLRLYYIYIFSLPGVPILYYGDEIGMAGAGVPDNRRPMKWSDWTENEQTTFRTLSQLIHFRRNHPALAVGDLVIMTATEDVLAYRRIGFEEEFLVVLNKSNAEQTYMVPGLNVVWESIFGGTDAALSGKEEIIAPRSGMIFQAAGDGTN
ncbi:alpha-amylase family glycosyl hydrolase [Candidatus Neomarinimicrobiota bacterium]